jgi:hypothetical protein
MRCVRLNSIHLGSSLKCRYGMWTVRDFFAECSRGLLDQRAHVSSLNSRQNTASVETGRFRQLCPVALLPVIATRLARQRNPEGALKQPNDVPCTAFRRGTLRKPLPGAAYSTKWPLKATQGLLKVLQRSSRVALWWRVSTQKQMAHRRLESAR